MPAVSSVTPSGISYVDYVDSGTEWAINSFTYSFPTSASFYVGYNGGAYGSGEQTNGFKAFNSVQQAATASILNMYSAVANVTFTQITETSTQSATLRYAESNQPSTAWGYYPSVSPEGGDAWFNNSTGWYDNPVLGNYAWLTIIHETGHLLGLKHPQDVSGSFGAVPVSADSLEYTVMSYRSYIGASTTQGLTNATWSFPQTLMLYDIAALQYMYGANYNTNSGNTVYKWNPSTGQETINGVAQTAPGGNTIFMTLWDGGGNDTYDLSNYTTNLNVSLQPGGWTTTSAVQLANLGAGHTAIGNIANAYLYNNNPASLIENAIGGSGNDVISGNTANNKLTGGAGNDTLDGVSGNDTAVYSGPSSSYQVTQNADGSWKVVDLRAGSPDGTDTLKNIDFLQFSDTTVAIGTVQPPPPPPVVSVPVISAVTPDTANPTDGITSAKILTLAGTAQANATVKVYDGTMLLGSTVAGSNGSWNYTTSALTDGNHSFTATATDASGNTSLATGATNVIIDTTSPVTPTIALQSVDSGVAGDNITNVKVVSLTGVAEINSTITIKDGATVLGSAVANAEGVWKLVLDMSDDQIAGLADAGLGDNLGVNGGATGANQTQSWAFTTAPLADGAHNFTVTSTDAAGNVSAVATKSVTIDTVAPNAPVISTNTIVNTNQVQLTGTAEAGSTIKVLDGTAVLATLTANGSGAWSYTTVALSAGTHSLTAIATDVAGNVGTASQAVNAVIGVTTIESVGTASLMQIGSSYYLYDSTGTGPSLKYSGMAVTVGQFDTWAPLGVEKTATGYQVAWGAPRGDDQYSIWTTDKNGNFLSSTDALSGASSTIKSAETTFQQDLNGDGIIGSSVQPPPPPPSVVPVPVISAVTPDTASPTDGITSAKVLTLAGTAQANATVKVYDGTMLLGSVAAATSGSWSFVTATLNDGTHKFTATATDGSGNTSSASGATNIIVDTAAPVSPTVALQSVDSGVVGDGITNIKVVSLGGNAEVNSIITIKDGATVLGSTTAGQTQAWAFTTASLADGAHNFTVTSTDAAGNVSAVATKSVTIDTVAPNAPVISTNTIVNTNQEQLTGSAEAGSTVKLFDGSAVLGTATANTSGAWSYTTGALSGGAHTFTATASDVAGNTGIASQSVNSLIGGSVVPVPVISAVTPDTASPTDGITSAKVLTLAGTAQANATVKVYDGTMLLGSVAAATSGSWSFVTATLNDGTHKFTATATDGSGNTSSASGATNIIVDTAAPVSPTVALQSVDSGVVGDGITNIKVVSLGGNAEVNSIITIKDGATVLGSTTAGQTQAWAFTTASLADGAHNFTVTSTDAAGNVSAVATKSVTIDTVAPNAPVISTNTIVNTNQEQLTGSAEAGSTVKLFDGSAVLGTATANTSGAWSYTTGALSGGAHTFTATASDVAGNTGIASQSVNSLIGGTAIAIESVGTASLMQIGSSYYLYDSTGTGPSLKYSGMAVTVGQFDTWAPLGVEKTATGYQVAWGAPRGDDQYSIWTTDKNGNFLSSTDALSGASSTIKSAETTFQQDLNGDGIIGSSVQPPPPPPSVVPVPVISAVTPDTASPTDGITSAKVLTLAGTAQANATVKVYDGTMLLGSVAAATSGSWSFVTATLNDGTHKFTATATDGSGNTSSASGATNIIVDTAAPVSPTVALQSVDSGVVGDGITNIKVVSLGGNAEVNSIITIKDGATVLGSTTAGQTQAWAFTTASLADGAHNFTVTSTDAAGNVSAVATKSVTIDTVAPNAPVISTNTIVNTNQEQLTGSAEAGSTVKLFDGSAVLGTATANTSGAWSYTTGALSGGAHTFTATASDVAGNTGIASQSVNSLIGGTAIAIESVGTASLMQIGSSYYLYDSTGTGPSLKYSGMAVTVGQFDTWAPLGVEKTATGYQVAWGAPRGDDQYSIWTTDKNGNFLSSTDALSGASSTIKSAETTFQQDLNGDGIIGSAAPAPSKMVLGSAGDDKFTSSAANEAFYGNGGHNTFVFAGNFGKDAVTDFQANTDVIEVSHNAFANFADMLAHSAQVGADVVITVGSSSITLNHTTIAQLNDHNFHLV